MPFKTSFKLTTVGGMMFSPRVTCILLAEPYCEDLVVEKYSWRQVGSDGKWAMSPRVMVQRVPCRLCWRAVNVLALSCGVAAFKEHPWMFHRIVRSTSRSRDQEGKGVFSWLFFESLTECFWPVHLFRKVAAKLEKKKVRRCKKNSKAEKTISQWCTE